jgi:hypothetical protein
MMSVQDISRLAATEADILADIAPLKGFDGHDL